MLRGSKTDALEHGGNARLCHISRFLLGDGKNILTVSFQKMHGFFISIYIIYKGIISPNGPFIFHFDIGIVDSIIGNFKPIIDDHIPFSINNEDMPFGKD